MNLSNNEMDKLICKTRVDNLPDIFVPGKFLKRLELIQLKLKKLDSEKFDFLKFGAQNSALSICQKT